MIGRIVPILVVVSVLTGCSLDPSRQKSSETMKMVTVEQALSDIGVGLGKMKVALDANNVQTGLYVDSIDLDLVLNATADSTGKLALGFDPINLTSLSRITGKFDGEISKHILDTRNSTIKIKFKSPNSYNLDLQKLLVGGSTEGQSQSGSDAAQAGSNGQSGAGTAQANQPKPETVKVQNPPKRVAPILDSSKPLSNPINIPLPIE